MSNQGAIASVPTGASFSTTTKRVIKFNHIWTIENFHFFLYDRFVDSPPFTSEANDGIQWWLKLYPNGENEESKGYVSVFLSCSSEDEVLVICRIVILNADRESVGEMTTRKPSRFVPGTSKGFRKFIKQEDLLKEKNRYLPDDRLTLRCEVWYTVDGEGAPTAPSPRLLRAPEPVLPRVWGEIYESRIFSDVVLILNGREFNAHRAILSARSPIFRAMFDRDLDEGRTSRVEISDLDEHTLIELLRFIYTGEAEASDNMANLLAIIDRHAKSV